MWRYSGQPKDTQPARHRLVVLGGGNVGKTALLKRFLYDEFIEKYRETVEDLHTKTFEVNGNLIHAHILDTAGNMAFPAMRRLSITNGDGFLLVYSLDSKQSFQVMKDIFNEIKTIRASGNEKEFGSLPIVIAANKCDLVRQVNRQQIDEFMLNETLDSQAAHLETSAKTGHNVHTVFETLVRLSPLIAARTSSKPTLPSESSGSNVVHQNGTAGRSRLNSGPGSPRRKPKPAPTLRRFSLQAFNLTGSWGSNEAAGNDKTTPPSGSATPTNEQKRGSLSPAIATVNRKLIKQFPRRHSKTKSQGDLDIRECFVQ